MDNLDAGRPAQAGGLRRRELALLTRASGLALAALAWGPAWADTTVSGGSTPVATSTVAGGAPDNIIQTGTLTVSSGAAITLDSNNNVSNTGTVQTQDVSNITGVLAIGGHTGTISNSGTITLNESSSTTTTDKNGAVLGPFATGSARFGVRLEGPGALTGDILNSGAFNIQGNDSAGLLLQAPLLGSIQTTGTFTVMGDRSVGISTNSVSSGISVSGAISASGAGAQAISVGGDVGGGLAISSAVTATGYHTTTRPAAGALLSDLDANDNAQGGVAVQVGGSLGGGLLVSAPPSTISASVPDANGDGLPDATEGTGSVTSYGSAPAIQVGAVGRDISLGVVGTGYSAYGVVIDGSVTGSGLRDGVSATGLQLGAPGGGAVSVANGVRVRGLLTATSYGADATALRMTAGATAPVLSVGGRIEASLTGEAPATATAVVVEPGAALPTILNAATIRAVAVGSTGNATAILDQAGSLTHVENVGTISASLVSPSGHTAAPTGTAVAIDDSANTTGFSLLSYQGGGLPAPVIAGAVRLGSGADSLSIQAGTLTGDISFGAGANSLAIDGGASVAGAITADGGTLALSVGSGSLQFNNAGRLALTSLSLGPSSTTVFTLDPAAGLSTELDVAGPASVASGARIGLRTTSIVNGQQTLALVRSSQLNVGVDQLTLTESPYIYDSHLSLDQAAGVLGVTISRKSAAELALPPSIAGAYEPVVAAMAQSPTLAEGMLAQTTRAGFLSAYQQLLPEHSGGIFQIVQAGTQAFGRPLDDRQGGGGGGAWIQQVDFIARAENMTDLAGYDSWGVGLDGGYETSSTPVGIFGATVGVLSGELRPNRSAEATDSVASLVELGTYWRAAVGPFSLNARVAGDYMEARSHRAANFAAGGEDAFGEAKSRWSGWAVNGRFRASYEAHFGEAYLRPEVGVDYLTLSEDAHSESGGGVLDLDIAKRKTTELTGFAGLATGAMFGDPGAFWGPELLVGYRDALSKSGGETTARFANGGDPFTVGPYPIGDSGLVARFALKSENGGTAFSLEAGGESRTHFHEVDAKIAVHVAF
jgi:hypothetical protein